MEKYVSGYFTAHSIPNYTNVIIECLIEKTNIYDLNRKEIINHNKATYSTNNIYKILTIKDKKGVNYTNAVNIFENDNIIFSIDNSIETKNTIEFYIDKSMATFLNNNKIKKIEKFDYNGNLILNGLYIDGIFNGIKIQNGIKYNYKDGLLI